MSDKQRPQAAATATVQQYGPDDREPTPERQAELRAAYEANVAAGNAPYAEVVIRSRMEVEWILRQRNWSGVLPLAPGEERPNLSGANFVEGSLRGVYLIEANLSGANLYEASLSGAGLGLANLSGANLGEVNLTGTYLAEANLSGANLREAWLDATTVLHGVILSPETTLGDVVWNGAPLQRVDWTQAPRLGDEAAITKAKTRQERIAACRDAARAYHVLAVALRGQGLLAAASGYRLREQRLERRALRLERKGGGWFFSLLLDLVAGYGERPGRIFVAYVTVVLAFAAAYFGVTQLLETQRSSLTWDEALVLSLTSFHGRGFFPGFLSLGDWVARLGAAEAVIGLFIELILIATFSRRFLGNY